MSDRLTRELALNALGMALTHRPRPELLVHHSDRPVRFGRLPAPARCPRHRMLDEPAHQLLGQLRRGELLCYAEDRAHPPRRLPESSRGKGRNFRVHRGVLQSATSPLDPSATKHQQASSGWRGQLNQSVHQTRERPLRVTRCSRRLNGTYGRKPASGQDLLAESANSGRSPTVPRAQAPPLQGLKTTNTELALLLGRSDTHTKPGSARKDIFSLGACGRPARVGIRLD